MISYNDIKDAVTLMVSSNFENGNIYSEETQLGFNLPAFFIELIPLTSVIEAASIYKAIGIDIQYISDVSNFKREEILSICDKLEQLFNKHLQVEDRFLKIEQFGYEIVDKVLHFQIFVDYFDDIGTETSESVPANSVEINLKGGIN
ncbi:DUF6838 family protein [Clostridium sp. DJ247]|uniref:phage tail terminator family protein n=1 Tax=Clostridium sp. DJ247 TaxID=2726188 RepID=UPI001626BD56|nr:hypothetical protein [Clostridium sp. DJ247]MBC2579695.1 hypothetical protein [Clostridium sp. DJ247]